MLCAVCLSMFSKDDVNGTHHTCLGNLRRAAEGGCKICIALFGRRQELGPDPEAEEIATPFLQYRWRCGRRRLRSMERFHYSEIRFDSEVNWLKWGLLPFNNVDVQASHTGEPVPDWYLDVLNLASIDLDSRPWRVRRDLFPLRSIPESTGHRRVLDIAKTWLQRCQADHDCETSRGLSALDSEWYPKRLIDTTDVAVPRLLETHSDRPRSPSRYATLSHCWGSNPDFITLTTENIAEFCQGIAIDILPQSFRDAITVCNHLGVRYIWIDSLCILQDSHADWLLHTTEMSAVYQNCYLNISLDFAENPNQGAFTNRNTDVLQDCYAFSTIPTELDPANNSTASTTDSSGSESDDTSGTLHSDNSSDRNSPVETRSLEGQSFIDTKAALRCLVFIPELDYSLATEDLPLVKRGWVVQERLLSPWVLHFTNDRIRWECDNEHSLHEGLPDGLPDTGESFDQHFKLEFNAFPERFPERRLWDHFHHWESVVRMYSDCLLTYPEKDKLVALAAVAQRYAAVLGEEYYAGHFRDTMPFDLGWEVLGRRCGQHSATKRYPTWSWTSVESEVSASSFWGRAKHPLATVEDVTVDLEDPNFRYGPVNGGKLTLSCLVARCELGTSQRRPGKHEDMDIRNVHLEQAIGCDDCLYQTSIVITMDRPEEETLNDVFLVPLAECSRPRAVMGIILLKHPDGLYRRAGFWDSDPGNLHDLDNGGLFDYIDSYSQNSHQVVIV